MKNYLFDFQDYVWQTKQSCNCSIKAACIDDNDEHDTEWLKENGCCPSGLCKATKAIAQYEKAANCNLSEMQFEDTDAYKDYYSEIDVNGIDFKTPAELEFDFDYRLLYKLIIGSFSSEYSIGNTSLLGVDLPELYIHVRSGDQSVTSMLSELWSFQILRLFEIYIEEALNLQGLSIEDATENNNIRQERDLVQKKWEAVRSGIINRLELKKAMNEINAN